MTGLPPGARASGEVLAGSAGHALDDAWYRPASLFSHEHYTFINLI